MRKLTVLLLAAAFVAGGCGADNDAEPAADDRQTVASGEVPFDRAFIDAMVPHHREAIEMAKAAKTRGLTQPDLEKIASDIIASQQREIDQMLDWREQWFGSRRLGAIQAEVLGVPENELGMEHGGGDEIAGAVDADLKFAQLMITHHKGAIAMAEAANARGQHDEVKGLASAIIVAQEREIEVMEKHASGEHHAG